MTPKQLSERVKQIVNDDVAADPHGWVVSSLTDRIESEWPKPLMPSRKVIYDRTRRAARSLASLGLIEMRRTPEHGVTFNPIIRTRS